MVHTRNCEQSHYNKAAAAIPSLSVRYAIVCCAMLMVTGCSVGTFPLIRPVQKHSREWTTQRRAQDYFMMAREAEREGLTQDAMRFYTLARNLEPASKILRDQLVERDILMGKFSQAILSIRGDKKESDLSDADKSLCASIYMRAGKYALALDMLELVANKRQEVHYMLGLLYESLGNIPKAVAHYRACLANDSASVEMILKVGSLYAKMGNMGAAESLFVAAGKTQEQNPRLFNAIGEVKLAKGDTTLALDFFKMAIMIDSSSLDAARNIAQIFIHKNEYASAIPYYEKLYASDSTGEQYGKTLSLLYYYGNRYDKAVSLLHTLLNADIDDYELHFYLGLAYEAQDSLDMSHVEFEKALAIRGDYGDAWLKIAYTDLKQKDLDAALGDAKQFTKRMPASGASWRTLGYVCNARKEYANALPYLRKALAIDSSDEFAWYELGSALERTGDPSSAAAAFRRVLRLKPDDAAAANYLGYMWADKGVNLDSAKNLIGHAVNLDTSNGAYLDSYAWVLFKLGKLDSALVYVKKAAKYIDDDGVVFSHYGDILLGVGKASEAIIQYKKSLDVDPKSDESEHVREKIRQLEAKPVGVEKGGKTR
jgi:tetratricopeptide (TPR) repeat protein